VPDSATDEDLRTVAAFRSRSRLPVCVLKLQFWAEFACIWFCRLSMSPRHHHCHRMTIAVVIIIIIIIPYCFQFKCPHLPHPFGWTLDWYLRRLARDAIFIPKTLGHYTAFQFSQYIRALFPLMKNRTSSHSIFWFFTFSALLNFTTEGEKIMNIE